MKLKEQVKKEGSAWNLKGRHTLINLEKKEATSRNGWPRLTEDKTKNQNI